MAKCYASKVIEIAFQDEDYLEKKSNTSLYDKTKNAGNKNYTKYAYELDQIEGFYNGKKNGYPYCAVAVDYWQVKAFGVEDMKRITFHSIYGAGCTWCAKQYEKADRLYKTPKVGDEAFFRDSKGEYYHTGLVYKVDSTYVYTIEANTSDSKAVVANGGATCKKKYPVNATYIRYGRPLYDAEPKKETTKTQTTTKTNSKAVIKEWQQSAIKDGYKFPKYGADGEWGSECEAVAKKAICKKQLIGYKNKNLTKIVQKAVGVKADGLFGNDTKKAVIAYQKKKGLTADGVVGYNTWKKILGVK